MRGQATGEFIVDPSRGGRPGGRIRRQVIVVREPAHQRVQQPGGGGYSGDVVRQRIAEAEPRQRGNHQVEGLVSSSGDVAFGLREVLDEMSE